MRLERHWFPPVLSYNKKNRLSARTAGGQHHIRENRISDRKVRLSGSPFYMARRGVIPIELAFLNILIFFLSLIYVH